MFVGGFFWQPLLLRFDRSRRCTVERASSTQSRTVGPRTCRHFPRGNKRHRRRADLLSTRRNLAALTKEDQGSQRNVSRLGIWRSAVAIALPSCCFAESRPPSSPSHAAHEKRKNEICANVIIGDARRALGFFRRSARLRSRHRVYSKVHVHFEHSLRLTMLRNFYLILRNVAKIWN